MLDLGCGAGLGTVMLAERGFRVRAVDSSEEMVALTSRHAAESGVGDLVEASVGDAHALGLQDASASLVLALGLLPWARSPSRVLAEVARVLEADGHAIVSADNGWRASYLVDPRFNPLIVPLKRLARRFRPRPTPDPHRYDRPSAVDATIAAAGLEKVQARTIGFGPFTFLARPVLPEDAGLGVDRRLQRLADRDVPIVRGLGSHYLVRARKP